MRDLERDAETLRKILPGGERITGIAPLTTGFSNETYRIDGLDLILRLPPSAGAMLDGHGVLAQARIYRELGAVSGGPPVPAIIHIEEDETALGVPFFVMERAPGEAIHDTQLQDWFTSATDDFRAGICRQWIGAFASLARMQPLAVLGDPVSPEDDALMWQRFAARAGCGELVALAARAPRSGPPALVHGDTKLSNLMWADGRVSAMLDWEMALNGEPLADLGYLLHGFESPHHGPTTPMKQPGMARRAEIIALWESHSGRSAAGVEWHEIAQIGKINAIVAEGSAMFASGRSSDPKLAYFQKNLDYYLGVMRAMLDGGGF